MPRFCGDLLRASRCCADPHCLVTIQIAVDCFALLPKRECERACERAIIIFSKNYTIQAPQDFYPCRNSQKYADIITETSYTVSIACPPTAGRNSRTRRRRTLVDSNDATSPHSRKMHSTCAPVDCCPITRSDTMQNLFPDRQRSARRCTHTCRNNTCSGGGLREKMRI